jgi:hypothetical protein
MRTSLLLATVIATLGLATQLSAQEPIPPGEPISDYSMGSYAGGCSSCGGRHGLHRHGCRGCGLGCKQLGHHRKNYDGLDRGFNCGCTGSYKFPVPPQYTYFWPGSVYSLDLMTNYHSPWRFPPLKPYTEETLAPAGADVLPENGLRPVSNYEVVGEPKLPPGQIEPMSAAMQRFFR